MDQDRREKNHRGVEIEQGRHDGDGHCCAGKEDDSVRSKRCEPVPGCREQAVFIGDEADQEQTGHQDERRPDLAGGRLSLDSIERQRRDRRQ